MPTVVHPHPYLDLRPLAVAARVHTAVLDLTAPPSASCQAPDSAATSTGTADAPAAASQPPARRARGDSGQATTEYALVLLAAALVGLLVVGWATAGGGAAKVGRLFDRVIDSVIDKV